MIRILLVSFFALANFGCATKIRAYEVNRNPDGPAAPRKGGIPFFLPKPALSIKEAIETSRRESVYALIQLGGTELFLYRLMPSDSFQDAIKRLRKLREYGLNDKIVLIPAPDGVSFLTKDESKMETSQTATTTTGDKEVVQEQKVNKLDSLKEFEASPARTAKDEAVLYQSADAAKAIDVILIPDETREFELLIQPGRFASSTIAVNLSDGWRLASINAETGENQLIKSLTDLVTGTLTAQKEIKLAEIGKEQALELQRLKGDGLSADDLKEERGAAGEKYEEVQVIGYVKRIDVELLTPGIYPIDCSLAECDFTFPTHQASYWRRLEF